MRLVSRFSIVSLILLGVLGQFSLVVRAQGRSALELMQQGSVYYLRRDYKNAIGFYQKALNLEKANRTLDQALWRVLVDNLGMSYGITGDLRQAKRIFEYGISKDPKYPMFYYNMACTYGEMDYRDKAIEYLKMAFERKRNMIKGERMPNPSRDSSFARFREDPKFQAALRELQ